ncbi:MAG: hypothetical protein ABR949_09350 [Candidatus Aquilonibacter sp.]|jgi:hypothetical protein
MVAFSRPLVALLAAASILTACGGGAGASSVPAAGLQRGQSGSAALSVFVPSAASTSARHRSQLPSSTQSVAIAVTSASGTPLSPPVTPVIANVSATAAGCSSVSGGISCTIDVTVPFGSLLFAVVGYSGQNATGTAIAWGETTATIGATGTNAVSVSTSSVIEYVAVDLEGELSLVTVDHSGNTVTVANPVADVSFTGALTYLPNGDVKLVVTSSTDGNTAVGYVAYARELPGATLTFFATNSSSPPVTGAVTSGADWGVGTELSPCPSAAASYNVSVAAIEGPEYQEGTNLTTGDAYQSGTAAISVSSGSATLNFSGESYTINGTQVQAQTGTNAACSAGIFPGQSGENGSGPLAYDAAGVIVGANQNPGQPASLTEGFAGFSFPSGSTLNLSAITSGTYDGFIGGYNVGETTVTDVAPINVSPGGANTLNACNYTNFEAGTVATSGCATITFGPPLSQPGAITCTFAGSVPCLFVVQQISGKYVIFGVVGSENVALIQH